MENRQQKSGDGRTTNNMWIGVIFILGGILVLLNQYDLLPVELNWWALFMLFPAVGVFSGAYNRYRSEGSMFSMGVMVPGLIGLFIVGFAFIMLFNVSFNIWNLLWPLMMIVIGLGMVLNRSRR